MTISLRPYQEDAVAAVISELDTTESTLLVASVGAGKTIMQAAFIQRMIEAYPVTRFICAVHTRELVTQNATAMLEAWPFAPVGVNSAALGQRNTTAQILFCSIQSVYKQAETIGWCDCLIIDECHLISPKSTTMYRAFIDALRAINPDLHKEGMSGTPYRMDSGMLTEVDDALFKTVAYDVGVGRLIADGFLVPPVSKNTATKFDLSGVHLRGGEYIAGELEAAVNKSEVTEAAVAEMVGIGRAENRQSWLAFCAGVAHATEVRDEIRRHGITCEMVEGAMDAGHRKRTLEAYKRGEIRCLTNVNVLSIGFNHPPTDLLALLRPTKSAALYVQQVGRGLRLSPGKANCRVLDFAGVVSELGPIDDVRIKRPGKGAGEAPIRLCPQCDCINHAAARECIDCGFEFPESEKPKHQASADIIPILSTAEPIWQPVNGRNFAFHPAKEAGRPPSVKVTYRLGLRTQSEWVCPEHEKFPKVKADKYWRAHSGRLPFPKTVEDFLARADELDITTAVQIKPRPGTKYKDVVAWQAGVADGTIAGTAPEASTVAASNDNMPAALAAGDEWQRPRWQAAELDDDIPF